MEQSSRKTLNIRIDRADFDRLNTLTAEQDDSVAKLVRKAVKQYLTTQSEDDAVHDREL